MNTRAFATTLLSLAAFASQGLAEDAAPPLRVAQVENPGFIIAQDPLPQLPPESLVTAVTCFKLEDPANSCVIASKPIVNYVTPSFNVIDLNGAWAGPGDERPYIYLYGDSQYSSGYTIMVDMTLLNRPDAFGYLVDASTIVVVFPDDRDYTGTIVNGNSIHWSNNSVWTKR
jgi:hypothetical protein